MFDEETGFLEPYYPPANLPSGREDHRRFAPGRGATGRAWEEGRLFHVRGKRVANDEFNLTDEQRELFAGYQSVAATPLRDDHDRPLRDEVIAKVSMSAGQAATLRRSAATRSATAFARKSR